MRRTSLLWILPLAFMLFSCGGINRPPPLFVGEWFGTWSDSPAGKAGSVHWIIDADGDVNGTLTELGTNRAASLTGGFTDTRINATVQFAGEQPIALTGVMQANNLNQLVGYLNMDQGGTRVARPLFALSTPQDETVAPVALCNDGTISFSCVATCVGHDGVNIQLRECGP